MKNIFWMLCIVILFPFCKKGKTDKQKIEEYVAANNLKGEFTSSGLYFTIDFPGVGSNPALNDTIKVEYNGYLLDGTPFDHTLTGTPVEFSLNQVIKGWQEGIPKYKKGGKGKLIIPSNLGYGSNKVGDIPKNSVLVFDIYLVDFHK